MTISLGGELPHPSCSLPEAADLAIQAGEQPPPSRDCLCLTLLQAGVAWPQTLPPAPVVSYTTFSPLHPYPESGGAVCFCGPIRQVAPSRVLAGALLCGVRTFLDGTIATAVIRSAWGHSSYHNYFLLISTPCALYKTAGSTSELFQIGLLYPQLYPPP